jgi:putative hydroxymethylpyrimidine transport system substrate-binding protein
MAAGCGGSSASTRTSPGAPPRDTTLVLDFTPNAVHAGIYSAIARHFDRDAGLRLHVIAPTASTDSLKLLETRRTDFAIFDIHDLAIARERGADLVAVMAIVEHPLAAVIASPAIVNPRQLQGRLVGITGVPSDTAVLRSVVAGAGGDPARLKTITIGFNAVADLLAGRVAAATAFWNDEGVTLARKRPGFHSFRVDEYGAPPYPELVLCTTGQAVKQDPKFVRGLVAALTRGYRLTVSEPGASASDLERLVPGLDPALVKAQLQALLPAFRAPDRAVGVLEVKTLRSWAAWETRFGIVPHPPDVQAMFDPSAAG